MSNLKAWLSNVRTIAAWGTILAFLSLFVAENVIVELNPQGYGPWPYLLPRLRSYEWALTCRNVSLVVALMAGVISLPRWQSLAGLSLTLLYTALIYHLFVIW